MPRTKTANGNTDIHAALKQLKDKANEKEIQIIDYVASLYEDIRDKKEEVVGKVQDAATVVNTSVHLYPWRYIGGAVVVGFLAGIFMRR